MVQTHRVTLWNSVPAFFSMYLEHLEHIEHIENLSARGPVDRSIRAVLLSGDWIPVDVAVRAEKCFSTVPCRVRWRHRGIDLVELVRDLRG